MTGGLGDEAAKLVGRLLQGGLQTGLQAGRGSRPEVLRHLAAAAGSVAAALEALAAEAEQARSEDGLGDRVDPPGTSEAGTGQRDVRADVHKIDVTD